MRHSRFVGPGLRSAGALVFAALVAFMSGPVGALPPDDSPYCEMWKILQNQSRVVNGAVNAECSGDQINCLPFLGHTIPWGNWGVNSNFMSSINGYQFAGFKEIDGQLQWNSCTDAFPAPDCEKYNANECSEQHSSGGVQSYAYTLFARWIRTTCADLGFLDGMLVTSSGNFMDIWELDGCDEDEHVAYVELPNLEAVLSCEAGGHYCAGFGGWMGPTSVNPNVLTAEVRLGGEAYTVEW